MLERGEVQVTISLSRRQTALMAALIVNRHRWLTTAELIECIWPGEDGGPIDADVSLALRIAELRETGIVIDNYVGVGYRLAAAL